MEPRQDSAVLGPDQPSDLKRTKMEKPELYEFSREGRQSLNQPTRVCLSNEKKRVTEWFNVRDL